MKRLGEPLLDQIALAAALGVFAAIQLIALHFIVSPIALPIGRHPWWDPAAEANVWTWANVAVLTMASLLCAERALARWRRRESWIGWAVTSSLLLALSLDDAASFHEKLGELGRDLGGGAGWLHFAWVVPGAVIAAAFLLAFALHARRLVGAPRAFLLGGAGFLFTGAIGFEMVSGAYLAASGHTDVYTYLYHVEEMLEAVGAALFLAAPLADLPEGQRRLRRVG